MDRRYLLHHVHALPRAWKDVARAMRRQASRALDGQGGRLFGIWRSQIGLPRDELTAITVWEDATAGARAVAGWLDAMASVTGQRTEPMHPTSRPVDATPPTRQGNYAFRHFQTPAAQWAEFLALCQQAWPGFEAAYDSRVIGLWRFDDGADDPVRSLLLTRRPDLATWERSKLPRGGAESEVRRLLSRRYDLCEHTVVYTTTLLTAEDREDDTRWT